MKVGDRIRIRRAALGISVEELAKVLGKNRATIYRYESNEIENMPTSVLEPLAIALRTTPAYLMGWEDEPTSMLIAANMLFKDAELASLHRAAKHMTPDEIARLVEAARVLFKHAFDAAEQEEEASASRMSSESI